MKNIILVSLFILTGCGGGGSSEVADKVDRLPISTQVKPIETINSAITTCSVPSYKYGEVQFPIEYLNTTTLTTNNSTQRLPNSVNRALATKDDWPSRGGPWAFKPDSGCNNQSTYAYNLWKETLTRIASAGADRVYIYNRGDWDDLTKSVWTGVNQAVSNEELKFIVDEATKRKLKVYYIWQLAYHDITPNHNLIPTSDEYNTLSLVDLTKLMNAWHKLLLEQAAYANKIGISGMSVDISLNMFISNENREYWVTKTVDIINDVRKIYLGELIYGAGRSRVPNEHLNVNILDHRIVSKVDAVMITLLPPERSSLAIDISTVIQHDSASYKNLTMQFLKEAKIDIDKQLNGVPFNVPIIFFGYKTSTNENQDIEDSFCVADYSWTFRTAQLECVQRSILSNFHKQANAIQGIFEAIISQLYFTNNYTILIDGYWFTDDLTPNNDISTGFPNLSRSIRNKPAENIVKNWYSKG